MHYDEVRPVAAGIDHQLSNLRCLLAEAHALGRLAVLPPLRLESKHNFGIARDWSWDTYFDLDASRLVGNDGRTHPLPFVREIPAGGLKTRTVPPRGRLSAKEGAELVVRQVRHEVFSKEVPLTNTPALQLRPSATVLHRAGPVIEELRNRWPTGFAAVHIRRGDRLWGPMRWLTSPGNIRRRLGKLGIHEGDDVFFLSDERDAEYWSGFAAHYEMARYTDFPELVAIVAPSSSSTPPDNYLLYEIEKEIVRHATAVLETFPSPRGERPQKTLVPIAVWVVARNVRRGWRSTRRFLRRCVRKSVKLAAPATRRLRPARSLDR
ncbi:MAG: hypothetical protein OXP36_08925 [Gammaproteobacteria bacterium]|nr:hypothetical protein [Gammaproteobacteria bacterium]